MPRKQPPNQEPTDVQSGRSVVLPGNPFLMAEAHWTDQVFGGIVSELEGALEKTQGRLGEAWEEGARAGHDLGFQAGVKETEAELRAFYEHALTEQEAGAARELQELEARHEAELGRMREANRREIERLGTEQAARLANVEDSVRRQTELELQHRFTSELAQHEARVRQEVALELRASLERDELAIRQEAERALQARFSAELADVEERVRRETEQATRAAYEAGGPDGPRALPDDEAIRQARAEGYTQGLNESARRYEEAMSRAAMERREASEAAYRKGFDEAVAQTDRELKAAHQEGYRMGLQEAGQSFSASAGTVPGPLLDEARRQAYENGYEDGRGVGLSRGRRQAEAEQMARLQEATRVAYREGFLDGKRTVADAERSWAFGVLHLPPDATSGEVKQHYKRLSMALHPDQNPQLADVFIKNLNRAKQLLDS